MKRSYSKDLEALSRIDNNKHQRMTWQQLVLMIVLLLLGMVMLLPFFWSIIASFTPAFNLEGSGVKLYYGAFTLDNWSSLFEQNWALYIYNTLFIAFMEIICQMLFCSMSAYIFAKFDFYTKKVLYQIMLISMMLPGVITLIPQFLVITKLPFFGGNDILGNNNGEFTSGYGPGLIDSLFGVILPNATSIYGILFLRQFFTNLSDEIGDAARIDGASEWKIFWIYVKMAVPGITTLGLFSFVSTWNSYLWPSLILYNESKMTLGVALQKFQSSASTGQMMAGSLLSIIPIVILFFFTQKYFMKQTTYTGIK